MTSLPRVDTATREQVSREFDTLGPDVCMAEISEDLKEHNPELLEMASKCAADMDNPTRVMMGFGMFYRLLIAQSPRVSGGPALSPLPRVAPETRDRLVKIIDEQGTEAFTLSAIEEMEKGNPELLEMAHNFASHQQNYLGVMQGFALLYRALVLQATVDKTYLQ